MALFVLASKDGWVQIMYTGLDAVGVDQQVSWCCYLWFLKYSFFFGLHTKVFKEKSVILLRCRINFSSNPPQFLYSKVPHQLPLQRILHHRAVFLIMHNCRSITHRFHLWRTDVRPVHYVDTHIFSAMEMTDSTSENNVKFRRWNHACCIRFLSAVLTGSNVTSGSSVPMLIGWKFTSFPHYLYRFAITINLAKGANMCSAMKSDEENIIVANDNWISSPTGDIFAILQHAPPLPIPHSWTEPDFCSFAECIQLIMPGLLCNLPDSVYSSA